VIFGLKFRDWATYGITSGRREQTPSTDRKFAAMGEGLSRRPAKPR